MIPAPRLRAFDPMRASVARLYNYYLSLYYRAPQDHYFPIEAVIGQRVFERCPFIPDLAYDNRMFLERSVRFMANAGVGQFIDLGSGIPASASVHDIAREIVNNAKVVYVDIDEEALGFTRRAAAGDVGVEVLPGDIMYPAAIIDHPATRRIIDLTKPVGLIFASSLPFVPHPNLHELLAEYIDRVPSGSYVVVSHACLDEASDDVRDQIAGIAEIYGEAGISATLRTREQVTDLFRGTELVEPYVTYASEWRPDKPVPPEYPARACNYAAVGRKP